MLAAGSMSDAIDFDWASSALGPRDGWTPGLRVAVDIVLAAPAPLLLLWGSSQVLVFNQAYAAMSGARNMPGAQVPPLLPSPLSEHADSVAAAWQGQVQLRLGQALPFAAGRFDLRFTPLYQAADTVCGVLCAIAPPAAPPSPEAGASLSILVVEDNVDAQYLVCEMLKAFGHEADGVASAEQALPMLAGARYDVLFTDVSLPGMSGVELARRALAAQPLLHIIFASGYGGALLQHVEFAFVSLQKPYEIEQLQAALDGLIPRAAR
jgi:CheY-like chemotaxis protein